MRLLEVAGGTGVLDSSVTWWLLPSVSISNLSFFNFFAINDLPLNFMRELLTT